jgi:hypothetical protein
MQARRLASSRKGMEGLFNNDRDLTTAMRWSGAPASYRAGGAGLSFGDGPSEIHHWKSAATKLPIIHVTMPSCGNFMPAFDAAAHDDYRWMGEWQAVLHQGS